MRARPWVVLLVLAALSQATASAATIAVKAKFLIDGTGSAPRKDAVVIVQDGKIFAIGTLVPTGATLIDLGDRTLLPGFIDCHVHLIGRTIGEGANWDDAAVRDLPQEDAIRGVRNALRTLEAGFTTVRNVGAEEFGDVALRNMIREGIVPGPRMLVAGHSVGITGGHCDTNGYVPGLLPADPLHGVADGADEIVKAVRLQVKYGADVIKTCATGGVLSEGDAVGVQQYDDEELAVLVKEAHLTGRKVAAHAHGAEGIKAALRAGVDSIEHGSMTDDAAIKLFKEKDAFLVPTLMAQESVEKYAKDGLLKGQRAEKALHIAPLARQNIAKAFAAGVKVALGTDAGVFTHGTNGHEFELMVSLGMKPMDAILAGTRNASQLLGLDKEVGTVEPGKIADLVAVDGDPLADMATMSRPAFVMHQGTVIVEPGKTEKKGLAKLFGGK
jgi:imidazolonepropionase-like amidohydrolase